jgi:hypothetical protein
LTTAAPSTSASSQITIPMTEAQFAANATRLKQALGVTVAGKIGQIAQNGAIVQWRYDGTNVTASVLKKRPYDTLASVAALVQSWFQA